MTHDDAMCDVRTIREAIECWRRGPFEGTVETGNTHKTFISVRHDNHDADTCAGQSEVVSKLYELAERCGVIFDRQDVQHSGGHAHVYVSATIADIAGYIRRQEAL